jgi:putative spermidine/putrescine transport system substrate-binding protein
MAGCEGEQKSTLKIRLLKDSIPAVQVNQYKKEVNNQVALDLTPAAKLKDIFAQLQTWQKNPTTETKTGFRLPFFGGQGQDGAIADLVTLGDYWLAPAIAQELIQPIDSGKLTQWQQLPPRWQTLMKRDRQGNLDANGQVWGAPYRWGSTVIAYRRDKFKDLGWQPTDWSDLWRPELRDRISLLDQPREVIGLTLKKLGYSYNTEDLATVPQLQAELDRLHASVKLYSSDTYLQPLILGDTWVAVGWSTDILPLLSRYSNLAAVIPASGTALWADLWVRPTAKNTGNHSQSDEWLSKWIDFCWQSAIAPQLSLRTKASSPILTNLNPKDLPKALQKNPVLLPDPDLVQKSEFIQPLPPEVAQQYQDLWIQMRRSVILNP